MLYAYLDRQVADLRPDSIFTLSAMRTWVTAARQGRCICETLRRGFNACKVPDGIRPFLAIMNLLDQYGIGELRFSPIGHGTVGDDEARLLSLFAFARQGGLTLAAVAATMIDHEAIQRLEQAVILYDRALVIQQ